MKITFNDIKWRKDYDSDTFKIGVIKTIELDVDEHVITIVGDSYTYKSPYCELTYGGGVTHFELLAMHPHTFGDYINIAIFEHGGSVAVAYHSLTVPNYFENKCKTFIHRYRVVHVNLD